MKLKDIILFSSKLTLILLLIFSVAMAIATFVENSYDTVTAKALIYNATWFDLLILLLVINLVGVMIRFKLFRIQKLGGMLFHIGFVVMVIGAAITKFAGYEGTMHIREGDSSNEIHSSEVYFNFGVMEGNDLVGAETPVKPAKLQSGDFEVDLDTEKYGKIEVRVVEYIPNATKQLVENEAGGKDYLELMFMDRGENLQVMIAENETRHIGSLHFGFESDGGADVSIKHTDGKVLATFAQEAQMSAMATKEVVLLPADSAVELQARNFYTIAGVKFMYRTVYNNAVETYAPGKDRSQPDVLVTQLSFNGETHTVNVTGGSRYVGKYRNYNVGEHTMKFAYGTRVIELPFSLELEDFIVDRYPGSHSPSSFESKVVLVDPQANLREKRRIFMNNVLDYKGFRFFQSSYDQDEKGTILSVSNDRPGTLVTYFSYFLLHLGFLLLFFQPKSRLFQLMRKIRQMAADRKKALGTLALLIALTGSTMAQGTQKVVDKDHADKFGAVIVQTFDGRFQPLHTLAMDVVHKVCKQNNITTPEKGKLAPMQVFMDIMLEPEYWKNQAIIYVQEEAIQDIIGINGEYAKFYDFFDEQLNYKLNQLSESAYRKSAGEQSKFDKEIVKVSERLNIFIMTYRGSIMRIFPDNADSNHKWATLTDSLAYKPIQGAAAVINDQLNLPEFNYYTFFQAYMQSVNMARESGNYSQANKLLTYLKSMQRSGDAKHILPSERKLHAEIHYNKFSIFNLLKFVYMIVSTILLVLAFIDHFKVKKNKLLSQLLNIFIGILAVAFALHTYGMGLRWYLSGHAPWSNGYESLILVAWGGLLSGFIFAKYSKITLAATALLAFFVMLVAGFSNYDPQLTPLQPVLKSYWLIIHVATFVISYGFFGLAFFLGIINLILFILKTPENQKRMNTSIQELSYINEINLIIGIVLATSGTFLGAVWANESWGRYWGWDAKETWALIILMVYTIVLHLRLVPSLRSTLLYNVLSVLSFGTVLMTFFGVNYYFTKGLHSYASESSAVFPPFAWAGIILVLGIIGAAVIREGRFNESPSQVELEE